MAVDYQEFLESKRPVRKMEGFKPVWKLDRLFDFQQELTEWAIRMGRCALFEDCGLGKGQPYGSKVLTVGGWKTIESLQIGDVVFGSNGKPCNVTQVTHKSVLDCYQMNFSDGSYFVFDKDHLHILRTYSDKQKNKSWRVVPTSWLLRQNLRYGKAKQSRTFHIPVVKPIEFEEKWQPIPAYTLGALLGDGGLTTESRVGFTSADKQIYERVDKEIRGTGLKLRKLNSEYGWQICGLVKGKNNGNFVLRHLRTWGLFGKYSYEKEIPKRYLFGSVEQRVNLLRGLMDTDGYIMDCGTSQFSTTSKVMAGQVLFLVRSLGGCPTYSSKIPTYVHKGIKKNGRRSYMITFSLKGINPFYLERKASKWKPSPRGNGRWIDSIEYVGKKRTVCIAVDSSDNSYVTKHCIVTHNSVQELCWAENVVRKTNKNVLLLTPLAVGPQMVREGNKFGIEVKRSRDGTVYKGITVTNYHQLDKFNPNDFVGVVGDESQIIKHESSQTRKKLTEFLYKIQYRLLCTATPAPNDFMELGTSSEALGVMGRNQMLGMFFVNGEDQTQQWVLKGHAKKRFWQWMGTWARVLRKPSDLGFDDGKFKLPKLHINRLPIKFRKHIGFLPKLAKTLDEQRKEKRDSLHVRCAKIAEVLPKNKPVLAWCQLNVEGDELERVIPGAVQVKGGDSDDKKEELLNAFSTGQVRAMVTKPSIACWGLNWQHCADVAYMPSWSHEQYYQAIRRCWRFGQENEVNCNLVYSEGEGLVVDGMMRKERQSDEMYSSILRHMNDVQKETVTNGYLQKRELPSWLK